MAGVRNDRVLVSTTRHPIVCATLEGIIQEKQQVTSLTDGSQQTLIIQPFDTQAIDWYGRAVFISTRFLDACCQTGDVVRIHYDPALEEAVTKQGYALRQQDIKGLEVMDKIGRLLESHKSSNVFEYKSREDMTL